MPAVTRPAASLAAVLACSALVASPASAQLVVTGQSGRIDGEIEANPPQSYTAPASGNFDGQIQLFAQNNNGATVPPESEFFARQAAAFSPNRIDLKFEGFYSSAEGSPFPLGDDELFVELTQTLRINFDVATTTRFSLTLADPASPLANTPDLFGIFGTDAGDDANFARRGGGETAFVRLLGEGATLDGPDFSQPGPPVLNDDGGVELFSYSNGDGSTRLNSVQPSTGTLAPGSYTLEFTFDANGIAETRGGFRFSPTFTVPEPATAGLLLLGGGLLALRRRR